MLRDLKERLADPVILAAYLSVIGIAAQLESRAAFQWSLVAAAALGFLAWMLSLKRLQAISGTPTSKIASAAQGYVELVGHGQHLPNFPILSRLTHLPCVWYRFVVEQRTSNNKWERVQSGRSQESFVLDDGTGQCLVDPEHAEVLPRGKEVWTQGSYRYTEWLILPQEKVYVLGEFSTIGGENLDLDLNRDVSTLLAEWKRDHPALLARFDLDKDGQISEKEWMLARAQARREVRKNHNELRAQPGTHLVHPPRDGRLFLISNIDPDRLSLRYRIWAWLHLIAFAGAVAGAGWLALAPHSTH